MRNRPWKQSFPITALGFGMGLLLAMAGLTQSSWEAEAASTLILDLPLGGTRDGTNEDMLRFTGNLQWEEAGGMQALKCDGSPHLIGVTTDSGALERGFSMTLWVRPAAFKSAGIQTLVTWPGVFQWTLEVKSGDELASVHGTVTTNEGAASVETEPCVPHSQWVQLVFTYEPGDENRGGLVLAVHGAPYTPLLRNIEHGRALGKLAAAQDVIHIAHGAGPGFIGHLKNLSLYSKKLPVAYFTRYWLASSHGAQQARGGGVILTGDYGNTLKILSGAAVTTFNSAGLTIAGDGDEVGYSLYGEGGHSLCKVRYRKESEAQWREGMDLIPYRPDGEFRGSLMDLEPGTRYLAECQLYPGSGANPAPVSTLILGFKTQEEAWPLNKETHLVGDKGAQPLVVKDRGTRDAWILYAPAPGRPTVIDAGLEQDHAVLIRNADYVILENLTLRGGRKDCVKIENSHHVVIRRCDISGWGDPGIRKEGLEMGLYVDEGGKLINHQAGVRVDEGSSDVLIEDNFIHAPRGTASSWKYGHPNGPCAILLSKTKGHHVIRNNDLVGSETHWWNDVIESVPNKDIFGGPHRDSDIYGNTLIFANDDGMELDGGQINVRFWNNLVTHTFCGLSFAPNRRGPAYAFRNLFFMDGEERGITYSTFKMGGDRYLYPGLSLILHNTIFTWKMGLTAGHYGKGPTPIRTRNNIFSSPEPGFGDIQFRYPEAGDFDYDLLHPGNIYGPEQLPEHWERNGVVGTPVFRDAAAGDFRLAEGSPGLDRGVRLPGLNDTFTGKGPDLGAFEDGSADRLFPYRKSVEIKPLVTNLIWTPGTAALIAEIRAVIPPELGREWRVYENSGGWLQCTPPSGNCLSEAQTIKVMPGESALAPGLRRAALTIRTDRGFQRTVLVNLKVAAATKVCIVLEAESGNSLKGFTREKEEGASKGEYIVAPEGNMGKDEKPKVGTFATEKGPLHSEWRVDYEFEIEKEGIYFLAGRCRIQSPSYASASHDSLFFSVDGGPVQRWDFNRLPAGRWGWIMAHSFTSGTDPFPVSLGQGRHRLTIHPREPGVALDCFAITNQPFVEEP